MQCDELTAELFEFHEVVDHMQEEEEAVIDAHREIIEVVHSPITACQLNVSLILIFCKRCFYLILPVYCLYSVHYQATILPSCPCL